MSAYTPYNTLWPSELLSWKSITSIPLGDMPDILPWTLAFLPDKYGTFLLPEEIPYPITWPSLLIPNQCRNFIVP